MSHVITSQPVPSSGLNARDLIRKLPRFFPYSYMAIHTRYRVDDLAGGEMYAKMEERVLSEVKIFCQLHLRPVPSSLSEESNREFKVFTCMFDISKIVNLRYISKSNNRGDYALVDIKTEILTVANKEEILTYLRVAFSEFFTVEDISFFVPKQSWRGGSMSGRIVRKNLFNTHCIFPYEEDVGHNSDTCTCYMLICCPMCPVCCFYICCQGMCCLLDAEKVTLAENSTVTLKAGAREFAAWLVYAMLFRMRQRVRFELSLTSTSLPPGEQDKRSGCIFYKEPETLTQVLRLFEKESDEGIMRMFQVNVKSAMLIDQAANGAGGNENNGEDEGANIEDLPPAYNDVIEGNLQPEPSLALLHAAIREAINACTLSRGTGGYFSLFMPGGISVVDAKNRHEYMNSRLPDPIVVNGGDAALDTKSFFAANNLEFYQMKTWPFCSSTVEAEPGLRQNDFPSETWDGHALRVQEWTPSAYRFRI